MSWQISSPANRHSLVWRGLQTPAIWSRRTFCHRSLILPLSAAVNVSNIAVIFITERSQPWPCAGLLDDLPAEASLENSLLSHAMGLQRLRSIELISFIHEEHS